MIVENNTIKNHNITIDGRKRGIVSGVNKVLSASPNELALDTSAGGLSIRGNDLHIISFSEQSGALSFDGEVQRFDYSKPHTSLLKKFFK